MYSFYEWCINNNRKDLINRWDNELNEDMNNVSYKSNKKYYFKCPNNKHESNQFILCDITSFKNKNVKCKKCSSFAQYIIDIYGEEYLNSIWSKENNDSPWDISYKSNKYFSFNCLNNSNHIYRKTLYHFSNGSRCPYCSNHKVTKDNSLGVVFPEIKNIWSDKNIQTYFDYTPGSSACVFWKCENGLHEDYMRSIANSKTHKFKCPKCSNINGSKLRRKNIAGQNFGELKAICINEKDTQNNKRVYWDCLCSCGNYCSISEDKLVSNNTQTCGNRSIHYSGDNNGNWKGGITPKLLSERMSLQYNNWRNKIYEKDWYTCQCCGKFKNINKNAHHIYNFSNNIDKRYLLSNGILLCDECHSATIPTGFHYLYGTKNNTPEQLEEYINKRRLILNIDIIFSIKSYLEGNNLKPNDIFKGEETCQRKEFA